MDKEKAPIVKNVEIFVRILPPINACDSFVKIDDNRKDLYVRCLQDMKRADKMVKYKSPVYWRFKSDRVFHDTSQEEVYQEVSKNLLNNILDGANSILISYGQTGTGKSFSTSGLRNSYEHRGIIPRLLSDMFEEKRNRKYSNKIEYRLSYIEIYQNHVNDLLVGKKEHRKFSTRDALKHVTSVLLKNEYEALKKIFEGEARKVIEAGATYEASHQGTSILTFHVSNTSLITSWAVAVHSKIHIVDMAGVDSVGKTRSHKSAEQISNANLEKAQMEQFIIDLQCANKSKIRSHSSSLLKYLGAEFRLCSLLRFIAHIRVTNDDLVVTLSVLRFGSNVKKLKPQKIEYNDTSDSILDVEKLKKDIADLKQELDINDMLLNQEASTNISISRAEQIERDAIDYINGNLDDLMLLSVSQAQILLKTFKNMFAKLREDHKVALEQAAREAYDSATKEFRGSTLSVTKSSKTTLTGSSGKIRRKKSAVERLSKVGSQTVLADVDETTKSNKVGELVDSGITIGPGEDRPAFGPVVRLMKIQRCGELLNTGTVVLCSDSVDSDKPTKTVQERNDAFECFLREDEAALALKKEFDETRAAREAGESLIRDLVTKHADIKTELETVRVEFHKEQNMRHLMGNEVYDHEGRILIPESERRLFNVLTSLEKDVLSMQCEVVKANAELRQLVENERDVNCKLECAFQTFCAKFDDRTKLEDVGTKEQPYERDSIDASEKIKSKFAEMQNMMKQMIENKPLEKKEWCSHAGISKK